MKREFCCVTATFFQKLMFIFNRREMFSYQFKASGDNFRIFTLHFCKMIHLILGKERCSRSSLFQSLIMSDYYHTSDIAMQLIIKVFQSLILTEFMT